MHSSKALVAATRSYLSALLRWLFKPWRVWVTFGVLPAVVALYFLLPGTIDVENRIRYCGVTLQLLTFAILAFLLHDKRLTFKRPSVFEQIQSYLAQRPRFRVQRQELRISVSATIKASSYASGTLSLWMPKVETASTEERLAALENNLNTLKRDVESAAHRLQDSVNKHYAEFTEERKSRESTDSVIRGQIERLAVGNLNLEFLNIVLLLFGIVFATIPDVIATLIP